MYCLGPELFDFFALHASGPTKSPPSPSQKWRIRDLDEAVGCGRAGAAGGDGGPGLLEPLNEPMHRLDAAALMAGELTGHAISRNQNASICVPLIELLQP